jgi:Bromodomain
VVKAIAKLSFAEPFRQPVPREVVLYYQEIKRPMDLGTVIANLEAGVYRSPAEAQRDIRRVRHSCAGSNSETAVPSQPRRMACRTGHLDPYLAAVHRIQGDGAA